MGGSNSFDLIAQEMSKQQQIMEEMLAENRRLRQQVAELRAGEHISLEINGIRIPLKTLLTSAETPSAPQHNLALLDNHSQAPIETALNNNEKHQTGSDLSSNEIEQKELALQTTMPMQQQPKPAQKPFLEEVMLSEFASILDTPSAQAQQHKQPVPETKSEEEQKEDLRRVLIGSYILE